MANVRPSKPIPAPIASALVDAAAKAIESMPARLGDLRLHVNPERRLIRSFLHHVEKSADCTRMITVNKARGNERAVLRKMADKARHDEAAAKFAPMVEAIVFRAKCEAVPVAPIAPTVESPQVIDAASEEE
jgi:hypothetical protein